MENKNVKMVRMNIRVPDYIRDWFKEQGDRYSVPYTNYISMLLTQIYEKEQDKILVKELNNMLGTFKELAGDVTVNEMMEQLKNIRDTFDKNKDN